MCHADSWARGEKVKCWFQGRLLPQAWDKASRALRSALGESNSWGVHDYGGNAALLVQVQGCMRAVFAFGSEYIAPLNKVPYLLARLREPGVRDEAVRQYNAVAEALHDDTTVHYLSPSRFVRAEIDAMNVDGTGMSDSLEELVQVIEQIPLDDSVAESPHSLTKKVQMHARASGWPWAASTVRLDQNLTDIDNFSFGNFQHHWDSFSSVLKPPGARRMHNLLRKHRRVIEERFLYYVALSIRHYTCAGCLACFDGRQGRRRRPSSTP